MDESSGTVDVMILKAVLLFYRILHSFVYLIEHYSHLTIRVTYSDSRSGTYQDNRGLVITMEPDL